MTLGSDVVVGREWFEIGTLTFYRMVNTKKQPFSMQKQKGTEKRSEAVWELVTTLVVPKFIRLDTLDSLNFILDICAVIFIPTNTVLISKYETWKSVLP